MIGIFSAAQFVPADANEPAGYPDSGHVRPPVRSQAPREPGRVRVGFS